MDVGTYNLIINQYATYSLTIIWLAGMCGCGAPPTPPPVGASPSPVDLTGYTATLQIRPYPLATTILYDASPDIVLGGTAGTIAVTIPDTVTAGFTWWQGVYDLLLTNSAGVATRLLQGTVTVSPGVST